MKRNASKKNRKKKHETLIPEGRTPPFRRLTCFFFFRLLLPFLSVSVSFLFLFCLCSVFVLFDATFGVARLTLQTPIQNFGWSVSRPTVTLVTLACVSLHFFLFFELAQKIRKKKKNEKKKKKKKNEKKQRKKEASNEYPQTAQKNDSRNRAAIEAPPSPLLHQKREKGKKKEKRWEK